MLFKPWLLEVAWVSVHRLGHVSPRLIVNPGSAAQMQLPWFCSLRLLAVFPSPLRPKGAAIPLCFLLRTRFLSLESLFL